MQSKKHLSHRYITKHLSGLGRSFVFSGSKFVMYKHSLETLRSVLVLTFTDHINIDILKQTLSALMVKNHYNYEFSELESI